MMLELGVHRPLLSAVFWWSQNRYDTIHYRFFITPKGSTWTLKKYLRAPKCWCVASLICCVKRINRESSGIKTKHKKEWSHRVILEYFDTVGCWRDRPLRNMHHLSSQVLFAVKWSMSLDAVSSVIQACSGMEVRWLMSYLLSVFSQFNFRRCEQ